MEIHPQIDAEERKAQREAVQAWLDSPDFPRGAGAIVFEAVGQAMAGLDDLADLDCADYLVGNVADHALRVLKEGGESDRYYVLHASSLALAHLAMEQESAARIEAFKGFHKAAFDYCATEDKHAARLRIRTKKSFRAHLLEEVRRISNLPENNDARLVIAATALLTGVDLFPLLRAHDGRRTPVEIMCSRLATFDMSRFAEPIPPPGEGTADGGNAAEIAFDLLRCARVDYDDVDNLIHGAERQKKKRARAAAAPGGTPPPPRGTKRRP